jgi:adenosine kinase
VVQNANAIDPTWAWDAYRWWLLKWLKAWYDWETSWKIWSLISSISVWSFGWQNHFITKEDFENRFKDEFWINIDLNYFIKN